MRGGKEGKEGVRECGLKWGKKYSLKIVGNGKEIVVDEGRMTEGKDV